MRTPPAIREGPLLSFDPKQQMTRTLAISEPCEASWTAVVQPLPSPLNSHFENGTKTDFFANATLELQQFPIRKMGHVSHLSNSSLRALAHHRAAIRALELLGIFLTNSNQIQANPTLANSRQPARRIQPTPTNEQNPFPSPSSEASAKEDPCSSAMV